MCPTQQATRTRHVLRLCHEEFVSTIRNMILLVFRSLLRALLHPTTAARLRLPGGVTCPDDSLQALAFDFTSTLGV